jgi:hypothetical protein
MSGDFSELISDAIEWAIRVVSGLGFFLPIAIFAIVNLLSKKDKEKQKTQPSPSQPAPPQTRPQSTIPEFEPIPVGLFTWLDPEPATTPAPASTSARVDRDAPYRHERDDAYRHEDSSLQWGSAFAANDAEKAGSAFRWGSVFDDQREQTKWGWDKSEWGGDYAHKRDSEPKITVG